QIVQFASVTPLTLPATVATVGTMPHPQTCLGADPSPASRAAAEPSRGPARRPRPADGPCNAAAQRSSRDRRLTPGRGPALRGVEDDLGDLVGLVGRHMPASGIGVGGGLARLGRTRQ